MSILSKKLMLTLLGSLCVSSLAMAQDYVWHVTNTSDSAITVEYYAATVAPDHWNFVCVIDQTHPMNTIVINAGEKESVTLKDKGNICLRAQNSNSSPDTWGASFPELYYLQ